MLIVKSTVSRLRAAAVAAAFLAVAASCGGSPQVSPPVPTEEAEPPGVALEPPTPVVSPTRPTLTSTTASLGTVYPDGESPVSTVPSVAGSSTTLPVSGVSVCCVSWSTEELAGFFEERLQAFKALSGPKYDVSTPRGALCWAWWEVKHAAAYETALEGRFSEGEKADSGVAFAALREALVDRSRRGDAKAAQVLLNAADVREPGEGYSLASVVESVNAPGVRATVLSGDDSELRLAAEALFAWVDEYEQDLVAGEIALAEDSLGYAGFCPLPPVPGLTAAEETLTVEEIRALTLEEVESLTPEQLRDMDLDTALDDYRDFPLNLQLAWGGKMNMKLAEYIRDRCCYSWTTEELGERLSRFLETPSPFISNENDPSTPLGSYCWSIWELNRSRGIHSYGYSHATIFDLAVAELRARVEMGMAGAEAALRGVPEEPPPTEYPFAEALAAVDDPRVRGTAFSAEDPVLLEAVRMFYNLVDEYRRKKTPSPNAFIVDLFEHILPTWVGNQEQKPENQALDALLEECEPSISEW